LRPWGSKKTDWKDSVEGLNNLDVTKWLLVVPNPYRKKDALWWINHCKKNARGKKPKSYEFAIELKSEGKVIGGISMSSIKYDQGKASTGYWINEKYHRQGYGSETLKAILDFAFNKLNLRRIEAGVFEGNPSSAKLLEKFGAKKEGVKRKNCICKAENEIMYGLLREEYKK